MFGGEVGFSAEMVGGVQFFIVMCSVIGFAVLIAVAGNSSRSKAEKHEKDKRLKRQSVITPKTWAVE